MIKRIAIFALIILLFAGCDWNDDDNGENVQEHEVTDTFTWSSDGFNHLSVSSINGYIDAEAIFGSEVVVIVTRRVSGRGGNEVESRIDSITIDSSFVGGQISITANMPSFDGYNYSADFEILAPPQMFIGQTTVNGSLEAHNFMSGGLLTTVNGGIAVTNQGGGLKATTTNGMIECDLLALEEFETAELVTVNGNIELTLPFNTSATFNASTVIGTVEILDIQAVNYSLYEPKHKAGVMGLGEATLILSTVAGNITIQAAN